ncbi:MAG: type II secretion system protein GspL [Hydrogenovibrio sp.]|uniref:type II secretion system protein GspL n=1 Tax=Hydrogenovibrio sp. TaxID=2065821 RepID=UPI0028708985|nr:type II secretion system protein GspL [Hydrogenovibrio sp.]MDR9499544.1 type II secretion system protein GspL [Hydrogenovibrio sp.]
MHKLNLKKLSAPGRDENIPVIGYLDENGKLVMNPQTPKSGWSKAVVFFPSPAATVVTVTVPGKRENIWRKALPFVLEEQLAEPVEDVHYIVVERKTDREEFGKTTVLLIARELMEQWYELLNEQLPQSVSQCYLCPDYLTVPFPADATCSVAHLIDDGAERYLVRESKLTGYGVVPNLWPHLLKHHAALMEVERVKTLALSEFEGSIPQSEAALTSLLQSPYGLRRGATQAGGVWLWPALALSALIALFATDYHLNTQKIGQKADVLAQQSKQLFLTTFPDAERIVNLRAQTKVRLQRNQVQLPTIRPVLLLGQIQSQINQPALKLKDVEWTDNTLKLVVSAESPQALERLSERLEKSTFQDRDLSVRFELKEITAASANGVMYVELD